MLVARRASHTASHDMVSGDPLARRSSTILAARPSAACFLYRGIDRLCKVPYYLPARRWLWFALFSISKRRCAAARSPGEGAILHETDSSRTAGGGQGNAGATAGSSLRDRPALYRRNVARGGCRRHAGRPQGQGHHGERRSGPGRGRDRDHFRPAGPTGREERVSSSTAFRAPCRRPRHWIELLKKKHVKLDAVVELRVNESALLQRVENRVAEMTGARRAGAGR